MFNAISAAFANRNFSRLLQSVREGHSYVITHHGEPIAKIVPIPAHKQMRLHARSALLARLSSQRALDVGRWTREELYEMGG